MKSLFSFELNLLDNDHRRFFIGLFLIVGATISTLIASSYLLNDHYSNTYLSEVLLAYALINLVLFFLSRLKNINTEYILLFSAQALILEVSYALWFQTDNPIRILWFSIPIAISLYIGSNLTTILSIVASFFSISIYLIFSTECNMNFVTITDSISITIILSLLMLFVRYRYHHDISALNQINQEMELKELALLEVNNVLDIRIQDEIAKHDEKEKMLLYQSRLAQMGELLSMIAHQWRQPLGTLAAINMQIDFTVKIDVNQLETQEDRDQFIETLGENTKNIDIILQSLSQTIEDFSDFYKPDKEIEHSPINEVVERSVKLVSSACTMDDIEIILDLHSQRSCEIYINELVHVVVNFINNARDQFQEGTFFKPQITIKTFDVEDKTILEVIDNAGGIAAENIEKIFEPYFSTKHEKNGTGLGLYMAKLLIEQHNNGVLSAYNIDQGACFKIEF